MWELGPSCLNGVQQTRSSICAHSTVTGFTWLKETIMWATRSSWLWQPFTLWTNHKNLTYLRNAKWLNSRQAWWALFLGWFQFRLTYRVHKWNLKPDSLSCKFVSDLMEAAPDPILPPSCILVAASWLWRECGRPSNLLQTQVGVHRTSCSIQRGCDPMCCSGLTLLS